MYSRDMQNRSGGGQLGVVAVLRLTAEVLALALNHALDEPLGRHQRHLLRLRPLLQRRRAGVVRHHHVVPAGGGKPWRRKRRVFEDRGSLSARCLHSFLAVHPVQLIVRAKIGSKILF